MSAVMEIVNEILKHNSKAKVEMPLDYSYDLAIHSSNINFEINHYSILEKKEINGFLNFKLNRKYIGNFDFPLQNKKYHVEFCSPNPTGPLHLGHCRNIFIGKTVVNILKHVGYEVVSEMYINDIGTQVDQMIETVKFYQTGKGQIWYKGNYVKEMSTKVLAERSSIVNYQLEIIKKVLESVDIIFDEIIFESDIVKKTSFLQKKLEEKNLLHWGLVENQKTQGKHLILNTGKYQSVFQRNDGQYTYFANDVCYHLDKQQRGFINQIGVLGEEHKTHMEKMIECASVLDFNLKYVVYNTVLLEKEGEIIPMSKREGEFIKMEDILKEKGRNNIICNMLEQKMEKVIIYKNDKTIDNYFYWEMSVQRLIELCYNQNIVENLDLNILKEEQKIFTFLFHWKRFLLLSSDQLNPHKFFDFCNKFFYHLFHYLSNKKNYTKEHYKMFHICLDVAKTTYKIFNMSFKSFS